MRDSINRFTGISLPHHPNTVKVVALVNEKGQGAPLEELRRVMCKVEPKFSEEEKAMYVSGMEEKVWPWFSIEDGTIRFENEASRWFLAGRSIESYECW